MVLETNYYKEIILKVKPEEINFDPVYTSIYHYGKIFGFDQYIKIELILRMVNECEIDKTFDLTMINEELIRLIFNGLVEKDNINKTYRCYPKLYNKG